MKLQHTILKGDYKPCIRKLYNCYEMTFVRGKFPVKDKYLCKGV